MGDIKLDLLVEAKEEALKYFKALNGISSTSEYFMSVVIFMQLINCMLYRVRGELAVLTERDITGLCKSVKVQKLLRLRNSMCHLYGTEQYHANLVTVMRLFKGNFYSELYNFMQEVVSSIEDDTFMEKYGIPQKENTEAMNSF